MVWLSVDEDHRCPDLLDCDSLSHDGPLQATGWNMEHSFPSNVCRLAS